MIMISEGVTYSRPGRHGRAWHRNAGALLSGLVVALFSTVAFAQPTPVQPGGNFGSPYPQFLSGGMTAQQFVQTYSGAMHNPDVYLHWISVGQDIRKLNPSGVYLKHLNIRTIERGMPDHPDYNYIKANHPEWVLKDVNGRPISLFGYGEIVDFGNDAYLDYVLNTWMPDQFFDSTDRDLSRVTWYMHDNGNFDRMFLNCAANDAVCTRYNTDEGVRTAWENFLRRFKARYPNKRMVISSGPVTFKPVADQLAVFKRIFALADGYFGETLTNDGAYWNDQPKDGKRTALMTTLQFASWLADNGKLFYPNLGMGDGVEPTPAQVAYGYAFFNLMRKGPWQIFSTVTKNAGGTVAPETYPEMFLSPGAATEAATQASPNVWRRTFTNAIAYVNLSDAAVSIPLPSTGGPYKNSLGQAVTSPLTLQSFSGTTIYKAQAQTQTQTPPAPPTDLRVN
jgi:hypothetical protein